MKSPKSKHVMIAHCSSILLLLLPLIGIASGLLHQGSTTSTVFASRPILFRKQSKCPWFASLVDIDETASDTAEDEQSPLDYDWDEQFEELKSFMSKYGHCNFPQNPSKKLEEKYPMLQRFCLDQRVAYQRRNGWTGAMSLKRFDRAVRLRRLEELDFEFDQRKASWYDCYHQLIQYFSNNGHTEVKRSENFELGTWTQKQRLRRKGNKSYNYPLSKLQMKLLDTIGFEWTPNEKRYDEIWNARYQELVAFRDVHGHLLVENSNPLFAWIHDQRRRQSGQERFAHLKDEQIRLLDEIDFPWEPNRFDLRWSANYKEWKQFRKKYGCHPTARTDQKLYQWSKRQRCRYREGCLPSEQIKLLNEIDFPWEAKRNEWLRMLDELTNYYKVHGHIHVDQEDNADLFEWMTMQRQRYHATRKREMLSDSQIEQLEDLDFCWSLDWKDRVWHGQLAEAVEFFKEHGHIRVTKNENASLYNWIQIQEKRYKELKGQKPLSEDELEMLEQIDFPFFEGQPRMKWNAKYAEVTRYRKENGGRFPTSHKNDPGLNRWMRQQRHRYRCSYGYAPLSSDQKTLLESIDFPMYPTGGNRRRWYEKYDQLADFWMQNGHFLVSTSNDYSLWKWMDRQRVRFHGTGLADEYKPFSKLELYLLERIGFTWVSDRYEIEWQNTYDEVVDFLEVHGHLPSDTIRRPSRLGRWVTKQRQRYKGRRKSSGLTELSEYQIQQLEKIGLL